MSLSTWIRKFRSNNAVHLVLLDILVVGFFIALGFLAWSEYSVGHPPHPVPAIHQPSNHAH